MDYTIYTDGSAIGNPGPGGYGALIFRQGVLAQELQQGFYHTTNNRMELWAVIASIEALSAGEHSLCIYSDSRYVVDAIDKGWLWTWRKNNFKKKKNSDLWMRYIKCQAQHTMQFKWIRGHNNHQENERCDQLAQEAAAKPTQHDTNYEQAIHTARPLF